VLQKGCKLDCSEIRNLTEDYVFGLLDQAGETQVTVHIKSCTDCAREVEQARSRKAAYAAWEVPPLPEGATDRLMSRLHAGGLKRQVTYRPLLLSALTVAAVIVAAVALPMLFLAERPLVMSFQPETVSYKGFFKETLSQELAVPYDQYANAYVLVKLSSAGRESPVVAWVSLNGEILKYFDTAYETGCSCILTRTDGLTGGCNLVTIENRGEAPLEFEITLVTGSVK